MKLLKLILFNFLTRQAFKKRGIDGLLNERLQSISIDFSYIMSLLAPFIIIFMITTIFDIFKKQDVGLNEMNNVFYLILIAIAFLILNKDIFKGQSVGKRIHGFKVVDYLTNESPSDFKLMIRNITLAIWPIDVVFALINPNRRLGDFIAGTKVIKSDKLDPETILIDISEKKFDGNSIFTFLISLIIAWSMFVMTNPMTWTKNL
jgi:uncharacterized RDD family membrane protein YckC